MENEKIIVEMQKGITYLGLIKHQNIQIPLIQRDYAQGRLDEKAIEIRDGFLTALIDALTNDNSKPLILDFIYGSTQNKNIFVPLDGQQRLTTLFLLHWYLAADEVTSIFRTQIDNSWFSKFTYETRISSKDFCNSFVMHSYRSVKNDYNIYISNLNLQIENIEALIKDLETNIEIIQNKIDSLNDVEIRKLDEVKIKTNKETKKRFEVQVSQLKFAKRKWTFSKTIKNQSWFIWSWSKDPTIKAMLVMLNEMDIRLGSLSESSRKSMWNKLEEDKIVFHLLPLEKFDLTDELYVKMNARGKELSKFDIFKSTLEEQMRLNCVTEETQNKWRCNVDSNWIDLFWNKLAKPKFEYGITEDEQIKCVDSVEVSYLRFLKRIIVFHLFIDDNCFDCNWDDENIKRYVPFEYDESNIINMLRDFSVRNDVLKLMPLFCKTKFFNQIFFNFVINSLENIIYIENNEKHDGSDLIKDINFEVSPKTIFEAFIDEKINYDTRVQFFAVIQFFKYNNAVKVTHNLKDEFNSWMRIIRNLSTNTNTYIYNGYDDFLKSLISIKKWAFEIYGKETQTTIIDYFSTNNNLDGFNGDQLNEEKIKSSLIKTSNFWCESICKAEEHKYFLGQIRFLLEWSKEDEIYNLNKFNLYLEKICNVFDENGLKTELCVSETHYFRNALMANSRYYLYNSSFIDNTAKNRDWSWKRYLRESSKSINIKEILDKWDISQYQKFIDFCKNEIKTNDISDWRKYFIDEPDIYNELYNSKISWWNWNCQEICLLSKVRWSSRHKELRTYYLHLKYKITNDKYLDSTDETNPFSAIFIRGKKEFSVKFIPKWQDGWQTGKYVVSSNFDQKITEMQHNSINNRWEQFFSSDKSVDIETLLFALNNDINHENSSLLELVEVLN